MNRRNAMWAVAAALAAVSALAFGSSFLKSDAPPKPQELSPLEQAAGHIKLQLQVQEQVEREPRAADSNEYMREHFFGADHRPTRIVITYRLQNRNIYGLDDDYIPFGGKADVRLREDGTWESSELTSRKGDPVGGFKYAADGKTIVSGFRLTDDLVKLLDVSQDASAAITTTKYYKNGDFFKRQTINPDGSYLVEYHQYNSKRWMKRRGQKQYSSVWQQESDADGNLRVLRELKDGVYSESYYRPDKTIAYTRAFAAGGPLHNSFKPNELEWVDTFQSLETVVEFASDGVTVARKLSFSLEPHPIVKEDERKDGWKTVRYYHPGDEKDDYLSITTDEHGDFRGGHSGGLPFAYRAEVHQEDGTILVQEASKDGTIVATGLLAKVGRELRPLSPASAMRPEKLQVDESETKTGFRAVESNEGNPENWWWDYSQ